MTFDLTAEQDDWSSRARTFSFAVLAEQAQAIEEHAAVPAQVRQRLTGNPFDDGAVAAAVAVEEMAVVSAGAAAAIGLEWAGAPPGADASHLPGLRGSALGGQPPAYAENARARLVLCAVAVGVGRAAIAIAVQAMKSRGIKPAGDEPTPHWTLADAAAEIDAARLLMLSAAQVVERGEAADTSLSMAARLATIAAERAVEAASLVVGLEGYRAGSPLERFTRDARTLKLLLA